MQTLILKNNNKEWELSNNTARFIDVVEPQNYVRIKFHNISISDFERYFTKAQEFVNSIINFNGDDIIKVSMNVTDVTRDTGNISIYFKGDNITWN